MTWFIAYCSTARRLTSSVLTLCVPLPIFMSWICNRIAFCHINIHLHKVVLVKFLEFRKKYKYNQSYYQKAVEHDGSHCPPAAGLFKETECGEDKSHCGNSRYRHYVHCRICNVKREMAWGNQYQRTTEKGYAMLLISTALMAVNVRAKFLPSPALEATIAPPMPSSITRE